MRIDAEPGISVANAIAKYSVRLNLPRIVRQCLVDSNVGFRTREKAGVDISETPDCLNVAGRVVG